VDAYINALGVICLTVVTAGFAGLVIAGLAALAKVTFRYLRT
jgi:hypothetical protein